MDPDVKKLLEENLKVAKANNNILKGMRRDQRVARFFKFLYWIIIIIIILGGYIYVIQPLLDRFTNAYESFTATVETVQTAGQSVTDAGDDVGSFLGNIFTKDKEAE